jgi:hypothetical protein
MTAKKEEFPDDLGASLAKWKSAHPKVDLEQPKVTKALHLLLKNGLDAENLLLVLELLRVYRSPELLENSKRKFQNWIKRGENLATRLRRDAKDFRELFPDQLDPAFVKTLLKRAEELDWLMKMRTFMAQEVDFGRKIVGTTAEPTAGAVFLVMASEIIRQITGKPRYLELSELLFAFNSTALDPGTVRKRISGFSQRNENEGVVNDLRADIASGKHLRWLDEFQAFERLRRQRQAGSGPASPSDRPST